MIVKYPIPPCSNIGFRHLKKSTHTKGLHFKKTVHILFSKWMRFINSRPTTSKAYLGRCTTVIKFVNMRQTAIGHFYKKFAKAIRKCDRSVIIRFDRILSWFRKSITIVLNQTRRRMWSIRILLKKARGMLRDSGHRCFSIK